MARTLSVKERVYRAIEAKLAGITVGNGYNTTIKQVWRRRVLPQQAETPPEIFLVFGTSEYDDWTTTGGHSSIGVRVPMTVWFALTSEKSAIDTECNYLEADIVKALASDADGGVIYDNSNGSGPGQREALLRVLAEQPQYGATVDGLIVGRIEYEIVFQQLKTNPNKWDENDTVVTE